jgi:Uma2 family endonuclease
VLDPRLIAPESIRPISRKDYEVLVQAGAFEGERVELLEGAIVEISPHGPEHDAPIDRLTRLLVTALGARAVVRVQGSFAASDLSEPEPDLAVLPPGDYDDAHPDEAWLIVEVARTSLTKDRGVKARVYAHSRVEEYWIVNVDDDVVERHRASDGTEYRDVTSHGRGEVLALDRFPDVQVAVAAVLRPRET